MSYIKATHKIRPTTIWCNPINPNLRWQTNNWTRSVWCHFISECSGRLMCHSRKPHQQRTEHENAVTRFTHSHKPHHDIRVSASSALAMRASDCCLTHYFLAPFTSHRHRGRMIWDMRHLENQSSTYRRTLCGRSAISYTVGHCTTRWSGHLDAVRRCLWWQHTMKRGARRVWRIVSDSFTKVPMPFLVVVASPATWRVGDMV